MYQRASAGGGGSDWYNVILLTTAPGAAITITDGDEEIEATGTGSQQAIAIHDESATYTISVVVNGFTKPGTNVSTGTTSGVIFEREVAFAEVTLTYDDDFRSQSGTISDGTTTANYTFPASDNETTIYIPSTGTWNVYCTVSGEQYKSSDIVVTSLSDSYTSDIHVRPNGKTVTPTDDIQTWLECGGIKGKFYTALDEVLADHETLQKLISDENAVDYMVRSKTWIKSEGQVPEMTDNTHPSGEAFGEQTGLSNDNAYKAFTCPSEINKQAAGWFGMRTNYNNNAVGYEFTSPKKINHVKYAYNTTNARELNFECKIQAYDGSTWIDLESFSLTESNSLKTINLTNDTAYSKYRFLIVSGTYNDSTDYGLHLQFYNLETGITEDETAMRYIGKRNYAADTLLADSNPGLVPIMTSDTTPEGECSASSSYSAAYGANKAFDKNESTAWQSSGNPNTTPEWIQYEFDTAKVVKCMGVISHSNYATGFKVQASNDGTNYTDLTSVLSMSAAYNWEYFDFNNEVAYKYYRMYVTASSNVAITIKEIQFYAKPADEPQWLDAICDSDYAKSVLNVEVPTMTDNTHPSGVVSAGTARSGYDAWKAFDATPTGASAWSATGSTNGWIQYQFTSPVVVKAISEVGYGSNYGPKNVIVQASNDGFVSDSHDLAALQLIDGDNGIIPINNDTAYEYYRLFCKDTWGQSYITICDLDFIGREDVDESKIDIYTATNDTVYKEVSGSPVTLGTISDDGNVLRVARTDLPVGTHKLGSTIAKDPDDLTADYTKDVNIFDGMIEIMLMPENALYWYGYKARPYERYNGGPGGYQNAGTPTVTENTNKLRISGNNMSGSMGYKDIDLSKYYKFNGVCSYYNITGTGGGGAIGVGTTNNVPTTYAYPVSVTELFDSSSLPDKASCDISSINEKRVILAYIQNGSGAGIDIDALWLS